VRELLGLLIAFGAIPRMVFGPVLLVIEGVTCLLVRGGIARALLAAAMLMDLVPLSIYALHLAGVTLREMLVADWSIAAYPSNVRTMLRRRPETADKHSGSIRPKMSLALPPTMMIT